MNGATAEAVWSILQEECGAGDDRWGFVHHQTNDEPPVEWRFIGALGFGGKFWRTAGRRPDETWGELWRVDCYPEDNNGERRAMIAAANARLWELQKSELLTCSGCGTTYDATDPDVAGRCVHDNLCARCWSACDRGRSCRDGCHERGE